MSHIEQMSMSRLGFAKKIPNVAIKTEKYFATNGPEVVSVLGPGAMMPGYDAVIREYETVDMSTESRTILHHHWQVALYPNLAKETLFTYLYTKMVREGVRQTVAMRLAVETLVRVECTTEELPVGGVVSTLSYIEDLS